MICTRPDVSFALSVTSRYQGSPGEAHWTAVKNILKYLRNTKDAFLVYGGEEELKVVGYTDASFQTDRDDSKSQAGYLFCLNGGTFSWKSFKEDTTADSTTESEYIAAVEAHTHDEQVEDDIHDIHNFEVEMEDELGATQDVPLDQGVIDEERNMYENLVGSSKRPLYPGCTKFTRLKGFGIV
ncbi:unnamed protein product [Cuscuta campestris]|uniref:Reverse transcriptase Ty1/copia-type domain-containing protein n=1 Tax=Cuscuta campestris TaxID=132261 RepID=A0A484KQ79_9ASTE|nr:unnamed protein product [Cuscuta campestris]